MHPPPMVIRRSRVPPRLRAADRRFHPIGPHAPRTGKAASGVLAIAARVLLAASIVIAAACSRAAPEEALRARIAEMEAAAEARDAAALDDPVADDFVGPGGMDRDGLRRTAALVWLRDREVGVAVGPLDIEVTGGLARVRFTAATRGGAGLLPDGGGVYEVDTAWRLEDGEWRLISADWNRSL